MKVHKSNNSSPVVVAKVKDSPKNRLANRQKGQMMLLNTSTLQTTISTHQLNQSFIISSAPQVTGMPSSGKGDILLSNVHLVSALQSPIIWPGDGIIKQPAINSDKSMKDNERIVRANPSTIVANDLTPQSSPPTLLTIMAPQSNQLFNSSQPQQLIMLGELTPNQIILTSPGLEESGEVLQCKQVSVPESSRINIESVTSNILVINEKNSCATVSTLATTDVGVQGDGADGRAPSKKRSRKAGAVNSTCQPTTDTNIYVCSNANKQDTDSGLKLLMANHDLPSDLTIMPLPVSRNSHSTDGNSDIGYTAQLLSQLNDTGALPAISCSQVSSVLSALEPAEKSAPLKQSQTAVQDTNPNEQPDLAKSFPTSKTNTRELPPKKIDPDKLKYHLRVQCLVLKQADHESNLPGIFQCAECTYLSTNSATIEAHFERLHLHKSTLPLQKRNPLDCIGCNNVFFSKHALQVHLIQDHEVSPTEVSAMTSIIVKCQVPEKTSETDASEADKAKQDVSQPTDTIKQVPLPKTVVLADQISTNASVVDSVTPTNSNTTSTVAVTTVATKKTSPQSLMSVNQVVPDLDATPIIVDSIGLNNEATLIDLTAQFSIDGSDLMTSADARSSMQGTAAQKVVTDAAAVVDIGKDGMEMKKDEEESTNGNKSIRIEIKPNICLEPGKSSAPAKKRGKPRGWQHSSHIDKKISDLNIKHDKYSLTRCGVDGCAVRLNLEANLVYHQQCHKANAFECPECAHSVAQWSGLAMHLWNAHNIDMELYSCTQCAYKTYSYSKLVNLHTRIHGSERPFLCDLCGKGFKTRKQMRNHKVSHKNNSEKDGAEADGSTNNKWSCSICGRIMSDTRNLRLHMESVHDKMRRYFCSFCGYSTYSRGSLVIHSRTHTGEKPFKCDSCEYATSDHNSLRRHKMQHSGNKPYNCPHCTYACIQSTTFKAHLKSKHPGLDDGLMFSCAECPFRTINKANLLSHSASHAPATPPQATPRHTTVNVMPAPPPVPAPAATTLQVLDLVPQDTTDFLHHPEEPTPVSLEVAEIPADLDPSQEPAVLPISGLAHGEIIISDHIMISEESNDSCEMIIPESQDNR